MRPLFLAIGVGFLGPMLGAGPAAKADDRNFLVFPVKTDLQRTAMGIDKNTRACVLVNSDGLRREDNALHWTSLDFDALQKELRPHKEGKEPGVVFYIYHQASGDKDFEQFRKLLRWSLVGAGQEMGFRPARWVESGGNWSEQTADVERKTSGRADADEPATGNELVQVYPVRTVLSRHLFHNADCVITVTPALMEDSGGALPDKVSDAILRYVPQLKFEEKGMLLFRIRCKGEASRDTADRFQKSEAKSLATSLGFEKLNVESGFAP